MLRYMRTADHLRLVECRPRLHAVCVDNPHQPTTAPAPLTSPRGGINLYAFQRIRKRAALSYFHNYIIHKIKLNAEKSYFLQNFIITRNFDVILANYSELRNILKTT